jgi:hypothetical protein
MVWSVCYIPPGKLPVGFDDLQMHNSVSLRTVVERDLLGPHCGADFMVPILRQLEINQKATV